MTLFECLKQALKSVFKFDASNYLKITIARDEINIAKTPERTTPTQRLSQYSIPANDVAEIEESNLNGYSALVVTVKASYDPNATAGVKVRWLYSPDGENFDSPEDADNQGNYEELTFSAGATRQRTILIPIFTNNIKIQIINLDSNYSVVVDAWTLLLR